MEGGGVGQAAVGENAPNRVFRLTTDMRRIQEQASFRSVQAIII
jgi:hypothetical protein